MATLKQIEANRRNAFKSTGPKTPEGKAAVSLNSLRHGLRARTVVLPGESRQEFHRLCDDLEAEWQPHTRTEQFHLEQMAVSQWKLTRMEVGEADIFREPARAQTQVPLLDRLWQCQCRLERAYARGQRELERLQTSRPHQVQQPEGGVGILACATLFDPDPPARLGAEAAPAPEKAAPAPHSAAETPSAAWITAPPSPITQTAPSEDAPCIISTAAPMVQQPAWTAPSAPAVASRSDTALPPIESDRRAAP